MTRWSRTPVSELIKVDLFLGCRFKDMAAREAHRNTDEYIELMRKAAEEGLLACPLDIKELKHVSGFALRK